MEGTTSTTLIIHGGSVLVPQGQKRSFFVCLLHTVLGAVHDPTPHPSEGQTPWGFRDHITFAALHLLAALAPHLAWRSAF